MNQQFDEEMQRLLIGFMLGAPDAFATSQNIIDPDHFEARLRPAVRFILDYAQQYRILPKQEQVRAATSVDIPEIGEIEQQHAEWYLQTIEEFARYRALERAILDSVDLLNKGAGGEIETRIKAAMTISLMKDLGTDYFEDPLTRLERMRDKSNYVSTGWKGLDAKLYGGFTKGALNVFAGGSGSGKSLFLQNIALNWVSMGMHVVYFTLELSEELVSLRFDAMVSKRSTKEVFRAMKEVATSVAITGRGSGKLIIKKLPEAGTTANDLRAFLKEYEIKTNIKPHAVCVDYLDLMHPNNRKINPSDLFVKDKYTSEEMRALAGEWDVLMVTASQLNRASVEAQEFDHSHIAGGISKINTADNVFGIFTSLPMRERGVYQIQFLKTRSAAAVGQKIELAFDPISLRITDAAEDDGMRPTRLAEVAEVIKAKTTTSRVAPPLDEDAPPPERLDAPKTQQAAIMNLLNKTKRQGDF